MAENAASAASMRSAVSWTLLGIVIEAPSHGYELAVRFERTYGELIEISSRSHIYTALESLAQRAFIEEHPTPGVHTPSRRHPKAGYNATPQGIKAHQQWLAEQLLAERQLQRRFTIQLAALNTQAALEVLDRYEQETLEESTRPQPASVNQGGQQPEQIAERLTAEQQRRTVDARLAWIEYARREFTPGSDRA
jgi:DNA-binding PadR family transcriptional regulator